MNSVALSTLPKDLSNVEYALEYADKGWSVFPVHSIRDGACTCSRQCRSPGKHPIRNQNKTATKEHSRIKSLWEKYPYANIGILTGKKSNLIVLDIDPRNDGHNSLDILKQEQPELVESLTTLSCSTGGNGHHYYFQWNENQKTRHNAFSGGIDIQSDGAYVIAPPSNHVSGGTYLWEHNDNILPYPNCLLFNGKSKDAPDARWQDDIPKGQRNNDLASLAGTLFQKGLNTHQVFTKLSEENVMRCKPPLESDEIRQIVDSINKYAGSNKQSFKTKWQESITRAECFNSQEARTLFNLSLHMDIDGKNCFPSQELLADEIHTTRPTVNKHLKKAEKEGWIKSYSRATGNGKSWHKGYIAIIHET